MEGYYDRDFVLKAVTEGVTLGLNKPASVLVRENTLAPNKVFYPFSEYQTNAITAWLVERLEKGTVAGPFDSEIFHTNMATSRVSMIILSLKM